MLKILIADDHSVVRRGLKEILLEAFDTAVFIGEASDGLAALEQARTGAWDVILLDITMPGRNGLEVLRVLKGEQPNLPVLMFSMHSSSHYVLKSLQSGASGYLSKEAAPEELVLAIQTVMAGGRYVSRDLLQSLALKL
jgi:two-component system, NarL family, invasion response regulator UvrY